MSLHCVAASLVWLIPNIREFFTPGRVDEVDGELPNDLQCIICLPQRARSCVALEELEGPYLCCIHTWGASRPSPVFCPYLGIQEAPTPVFYPYWEASRPPPVFYPYLGSKKAPTCVVSIPGEPVGPHLCFVHT
jgi:hypothetical protein